MSNDAQQSRRLSALHHAQEELLKARNDHGAWTGHLSDSALSTATALLTFVLADRYTGSDHHTAIQCGVQWLVRYQNADGGWGDTVSSQSNLSTTCLVWATLGATHKAVELGGAACVAAEHWLRRHAGGLGPSTLGEAVLRRYGKDRTFSIPILTHCALSGRFGAGREAWRCVIPLPFELAVCPHSWFAALKLPVVSYALPALIAMGYARFMNAPPSNPIAFATRQLVGPRVLRVLETLQPTNGGFLEATPLTSFVTMSLIGSGQCEHPVTSRGLAFLKASQRSSGAWPIDTNLATWTTTLAINALPATALKADEKNRLRSWLLNQQYRKVHPYTQAAPGGWAWTDLPGGVPDADDTAGALVALHRLSSTPSAPDTELIESARLGVMWLMSLQNSDGGLPTFCRGWGTLPFDQSSTDITAHGLRAWTIWRSLMPPPLQHKLGIASRRALHFLESSQDRPGSWTPLWFGNERHVQEQNPLYGTTRVLVALAELDASTHPTLAPMRGRALRWLVEIQGAEGGFGAASGLSPSVEETALALEALSKNRGAADRGSELDEAIHRATELASDWLVERVETGEWKQASPIGFYFARLWYFENLYPMLFTVGALRSCVESGRTQA